LIELFTQAHYTSSIQPDPGLSPLFKDVFRFHWMEESQHAVLDELEWLAEDATLNEAQRAEAVGDLLELVAGVDGMLQAQAQADAKYFLANVTQPLTAAEAERVGSALLAAYRYQYIGSGMAQTRFPNVLSGLLPAAQLERLQAALAALL
jgi:hypothetical protein